MRFALATLGLVAVAVVAGAAAAQTAPAPADRARLVDEVLQAAGERAVVDGAAQDIAAMVVTALAGVGDPRDTSRLVADTIDGDRLYRLLAGGLERDFDGARLARLLTWLQTAFGRRVVQAEVAAARASEDEIAAYSAREGKAPTSPRTRLLDRLDQASGDTEAMLEMVDAVRRGITRAAAPGAPRGASPPPPADAVAAGRAQTLAHNLFAYRELTDGELEQYVVFAEQEDARWFARVMRQVTSDAVETLVAQATRRVLSAPKREERTI
jgi:hypothetical protein